MITSLYPAQTDVQDDSQQEKKLGKAATRQLKLNPLQQLQFHLNEPEAVKALYDARFFTRKKGQAEAKKPAKQ